MKPALVIVGLGQLGCVFGEAFLRSGHSVIPVLRGQSLSDALARAEQAADAPPLLLIATGEDDLLPVLRLVPSRLGKRVILIQNELRPSSWLGTPVTEPTTCIVWFEKKPGKLLHEVRPSVAFGPFADLLQEVLRKVSVEVRTLGAEDSESERAHQLILKNLYILAINFAGLDEGVSVGALLTQHTDRLNQIAGELIALEQSLLQSQHPVSQTAHCPPQLDAERLTRGLTRAILADPEHSSAGRSAPRRLERTLALARNHGVDLKALEELASKHLQ